MRKACVALVVLLSTGGTVQAQLVGCRRMVVPSGQVFRVRRTSPGTEFASMQVDSAFAGVALAQAQRDRAIAIVDSFMRADGQVRRAAMSDSVARAQLASLPQSDPRMQQLQVLMNERNLRLMDLVTTDAGRAALKANLDTMTRSAGRCDDP
jgi:hypothetical protein